MKTRTLGALAVAAIALGALTLAVSAHETGIQIARQAAPDPDVYLTQDTQDAPGPGRTRAISVTAAFTTYLPITFQDYGEPSYYVAVQGHDGNDGQTRETAFRTINRAMEVVQPGDIVLILAGVYHEALTLEGLGNSGASIAFRGESGTVLDGQHTMTIGFWGESCTNLIFENLEIRNYTDIGIGFYKSTHIVMRNLWVHHDGTAPQLVGWEIEGYGIHADESQHVTVEGCEIYQNGPQPVSPDRRGTGIDTFKCTDCVIRNNHSHGNIGGGILVEDGVNVLVESNDVYANDLDVSADGWWDGGIWVDGGHDVTVRENTFRNNLGPGIQISDEDLQYPYGYVLENNTSTGNYHGIYIWNFGTSGFPPENILRRSNNQITGNTIRDIWIVP